MIPFRTLALALAVAGALAQPAGARDDDRGDGPRDTYILRFEAPPLASFRGALEHPKLAGAPLKATSPAVTGARLQLQAPEAKAYRGWLAQQRGEWMQQAARRLGRPLQPGQQFDVAFHGLTLELSEAEAAALAQLDGVAHVEREPMRRLLTDAGPRWIGAESIWSGTSGSATRGAGIVVGIIDSGINRGHPAFAATGPVDGHVHANPRGQLFGLCTSDAGAGCNAKLIGIHDFTVCTGSHASDSCNDREANNGTDVTGHGSHVAATAVGNFQQSSITLSSGPVARQISGVAPHANLISYKACEDEETCRGSWLLAAINQAVADGVDVINYSIGADVQRDPWNTSDSVAMLAARDAGIVVAVAAGNAGPGVGSLGSPANAPWVLAVANATHDRAVVNRLLDLSGGATPPPQGGILLGDGETAGVGPANLVVPNEAPLCSTGVSLDSPPTGASNPWPNQANRFSGEIVVCLRGTHARVAKSNNVRLAGGGGVILVNQPADGESTVAEPHSIPTTHLGATVGGQLLQWLSSGSGHRGRLEGGQVRHEASRGDLLANSSSRGPAVHGAYLKPDLTAPGSNVLAAAVQGSGNVFNSGTSMASPHVAGAAALLLAARPEWSASEVESALRSTAAGQVKINPQQAASVFDQGSGRVALAAAVRAGLSFDITGDEFRQANPATGGNPAQLNMPTWVGDCVEQCGFNRRVRDQRGGGRWRAELSAADGLQISVAPSEFELAAGAQQTIAVTIDASDSAVIGRRIEPRVRLLPLRADGSVDASVAVAEMALSVAVSAGTLPERIEIAQAAEDRGFQDLSLSGLVSISGLTYQTTEWVAPVVTRRLTAQDPTRDRIYDDLDAGVVYSLVNIPAPAQSRRLLLRADASSESAPDIDLFVGEDFDGDGLPEEGEELCRSTSPDATEVCELEISTSASARRYWVMVQNWSGGPSGTDEVQFETRLIDLAVQEQGPFTVTGPASHVRGQPLPLRVAWNDPQTVPGDRRSGFVMLSAGGASVPFARLPVEFTRANSGAVAADVLPLQGGYGLRLAAGAAADRLAFDVPEGASRWQLDLSGQGDVELFLSRIDTPTAAAIAPAPARESAVLSARGTGASKRIEVTPGNGLRGGRWYLTPVNIGTLPASIQLTSTIEFAADLPPPRFGAYFNPERSGAGAFLFGDDQLWGMLWYTYLQDRTPTWYIASGTAPTAREGQWNAVLYRSTWDGSSNTLTAVGRVLIGKRDAGSMQFAWSVDGESGSERYQLLDGGACPSENGAPRDLSGLWFEPARAGYGYSVLAFAGIEANGAYVYDESGVARWALGSVSPFGEASLPFDIYLGACPSCAWFEPEVVANAGVLDRIYANDSGGEMAFDLQFPAPMAGRWQSAGTVAKLTPNVGCPAP